MIINKNDKICDDKMSGRKPDSEKNLPQDRSQENRASGQKGGNALAIVLAGMVLFESLLGCATTKAQEKQERCTNPDECELASIECKVNDLENKIEELKGRIEIEQKKIEKLDNNVNNAVMGGLAANYKKDLCKRYEDYIEENKHKMTPKQIQRLRDYMKYKVGCEEIITAK